MSLISLGALSLPLIVARLSRAGCEQGLIFAVVHKLPH